jgi:hypothetical protein
VGNPIPEHVCTISPFDGYNSNVVNRLTRLTSNNEDCVLSSDIIEADSTSDNIVTLHAGSVIKDDVFISIQDIDVDFNDPLFYYYGSIWDESGYYYVLLYYVYEKTKPAPQPKIQILKPSERSAYAPGGAFVLIKVVRVACATTFYAAEILDHDPQAPYTDNKVIYSKTYIGLENDQPIFDYDRDHGRLLLTTDDYLLQYGGETSWIILGGGTAELENLRIFVGADGPTDTTPDYTSIRHIVQNTSLETAISKLDLSLGLSDLVKVLSNVDGTTPSILSPDGKLCGIIRLSYTVPTTITNFLNGPTDTTNYGILIIVTFENSNSIIAHDPTKINLVGNSNLSGSPGDALLLIRDRTLYNGGAFRWREISRTTLFHIDHDPSTGYHRLGGWHIGTHLVTASGVEIDQALDGISANVTAVNLSSLNDGGNIGTTLHRHDDYAPTIISPHSGRTSNENQHPDLRGWAADAEAYMMFWIDDSHTPHRLWILACARESHPWLYRNTGPSETPTGLAQSGITVELSPEITIYNVVAADWRYDKIAGGSIAAIDINTFWDTTSLDWISLYGGTTTIVRYPGDPSSPYTYANKYFPYGTNAYKGGQDCFEWISANKFGIGYSSSTSGDCLYLEISGDTEDSEAIVEVVWKDPDYAGVSQIMIGPQQITKGWGNVDHKCYFNFRGRVFEL